MNENITMERDKNLSSINLTRVFQAIFRKIWLILIVSLVSMALVVAGTKMWVTPQYEAAATFYVNNSSISVGSATVSIGSGDISASKSLVNTYIVILKDRVTLCDIIDYAGVDMHYSDLSENITAESINETEVFKVVITNPDPQNAEKLANAVAKILPKRITSIVEGTSAKIVSDAITPVIPCSPNYKMNAIIGFLLGLIASAGTIAVRVSFDTIIRSSEDITPGCSCPVLATVPDMTVKGKERAYYGKDKSRSKKGKYATAATGELAVMGPNISFAASEAYKLLRTKLQFSFTDENNSRVIGVSSALSGEGKSLTSVNLAYTLSQLGKKVLLVDCDMRRPTLAEKLGIRKKPGLSSYLTRQCHLNDLLQPCGMKDGANAFYVISAGENPPNPIELLSSERMKMALNAMRETFDYVILDFPPVGEVSDALAVAKETDGILMVVRQNVCDRYSLTEAVHEFEFVNSKILGVVFNCTNEFGTKYGKGYYKSYYKKYSKAHSGGNHYASEERGNKQ